MSKINLTPNASGTGVFTIASPNSNTDCTITLPEVTGGEFVTTDASGNVGIGTSLPTAVLTSQGGSNTANSVAQVLDLTHVGSGAAGYDCEIRMGRPTTANRRASIRAIGTTTNFTNPALAFNTNEVERMRIDSSGNVLVGTTSGTSPLTVSKSSLSDSTASFSNTSAAPSSCLSLKYPNAAPNNTSQPFIIGIDSQGEEFRVTSAGAFVQVSDRRIKSNIVDAKSAGSIIDAIKVREYDKGFENPEHWSHGFIAQEAYEVYPEAVHKPDNEEDRWGIDYVRFVPMLVKEIQDLKAEVAALKGAVAKIEDLESRLSAVEAN